MHQALNVRNASFQDVLAELGRQQALKVNAVVKSTDITVTPAGLIEISNQKPIMTEHGVTDVNGVYDPNDVFVGHVADSLKTGLPFTRRMFTDRPDIAAEVVNGLLHGKAEPKLGPLDVDMYRFEPDSRNFLFRGFTDAGQGYENRAVARALLSQKYRIIDNFDVVTAVLDAINKSDANGEITVMSADLTDRKMFIRMLAPTVQINAGRLLDGYRSPFADGSITRAGAYDLDKVAKAANRWGGDGATMWAGFELSNSETGDGRFTLTPRAEFRVCNNGLKIVSDVAGMMHLGVKLDQGSINWSDETQEALLKTVKSMTGDAIRTWLSADYWNDQIDKIAAKAAKPVGVAAAPKVVERVGKALTFSDSERESVLAHFFAAGQFSSGGVMNAITSVAQTVDSAERASDLEGLALRALDLV